MTDPISNFGRPSFNETSRSGASKADRRPLSGLAGGVVSNASTPSGADRLDLSALASANTTEPAFDRAKVDRIRQAIEQGQYAVDPKRIAESFVAIERMIKN